MSAAVLLIDKLQLFEVLAQIWVAGTTLGAAIKLMPAVIRGCVLNVGSREHQCYDRRELGFSVRVFPKNLYDHIRRGMWARGR